MDKKQNKQMFIYITFGIFLFSLVTHLELVLGVLSYIGELITPVIIGLILAFILNVPVCGFENIFNRFFEKRKRKPSKRIIHIISILLSIICIILVITLLFVMVLPKLAEAIRSIIYLVQQKWPEWMALLSSYDIDTTYLMEWFTKLDLKNIIGKGAEHAISFIDSISSFAISTVSVVSIAVTAIIIAIYALLDRDKLTRQVKTVLYAYVKPHFADRILYVGNLIKRSYTKFLSTQCFEAVLLGTLIAIAFAIFNLPYAVAVGTVTAICALIPYIGAFISCTFSVILALMVNPDKALMCLIVYLVVQFIEGQFIYPRVVGSSVGLSPLWTLVAVLIGGKLLGLFGMIFFIPLVSSIYVLIKEDVLKRQKDKEMLNTNDCLDSNRNT